jgi:general secretion pathway protein K
LNARRRGFALILVIWSLVLLASLATGFSHAVRQETRVASDLSAIAHAEAAATGALHTAVLALSTASREDRWQTDNQPHAIPWPGASVTVRVRSESGRIDINRAPPELLAGLFSQLFPDSDSASLADALIDWRDKDERPGAAGAEQEAYSQAGYAYGPSNSAFYSVNELSQVIGFNSTMVETAKPYLTVHSRQPRINAISADLVVLTAVPEVDQASAQAFIEQRENALAGDGDLDYSLLSKGRRYLDTRRDNRLYALDLEVRLNDGLMRHEHAVVRLDRRQGYTLLARETRPISKTAEVTSQ